jgi:ABC-type uncharacterized transport system auxiliary subunit
VSGRGAAALAVLVVACLAPRTPAEPRYFAPGEASDDRPAANAAPATGPELRLRRVAAADYLRRRMVWRRGVEVGFHDLARWTQPPASYVETRLAQELFERLGLRRATGPNAPSLSVELLRFDDVLAPSHEAVVELMVRLDDAARVARLDRSFAARRSVAGDEPEAVAEALGGALDEAIRAVGEAVVGALAAEPG